MFPIIGQSMVGVDGRFFIFGNFGKLSFHVFSRACVENFYVVAPFNVSKVGLLIAVTVVIYLNFS